MGTRAAWVSVLAAAWLIAPAVANAQGVPPALAADGIQALPSPLAIPSSNVPPSRHWATTPEARVISNPAGTGLAAAGGAVGYMGELVDARIAGRIAAEAEGALPTYVNAASQGAQNLSKNLKIGGAVLGVVELGADVVSASSSCSNASPAGQCVLDSASVVSDVVGFVPVVGPYISGGWTIGTNAGQAITTGYQSFNKSMWGSSNSLGEDWADLLGPSDDEIMAKAQADFAAKRAAQRASGSSSYQAVSSNLVQQQQRYDQQQAEIQRQAAEAARQQAIAQQQAAQAQANSAQTAALMNGILSAAQTAFTPTPLAPTGCHPGHDEAAHPGGCLDGSGGNR